MPIDDQVLAAMRKWPDVPAVHGWLRLGRRGVWFLVDRGAPGFDPDRDAAGSPITSPPILDFIGRNYGRDDDGNWFWQNGPQRVFVDLDLAPLVLRVLNEAPRHRFVTHTGHPVTTVDRVASDADGNCFVMTDLGPAVIDDRDIGQLEIEPTEDLLEYPAAAPASADDTASAGLMLVLDAYPGPRRLADGRTAWPIEPLTIRGASGAASAFGFRHRPRP